MIAGIDFDTHAAYVVRLPFEGPGADWWTWDLRPTRKHGSFEAAREAYLQMAGHEVWRSCQMVYLERGFTRDKQGSWVLARVQGAIMCAALAGNDGIVVEESPVWEWKQEVTEAAFGEDGRNGQAPKELVRDAAHRLGYDFPSDKLDLYDAWGVAYAIRRKNARAVASAVRS